MGMGTQNILGSSFDLSGRNVEIWPVRIDAADAVAERFELYLGSDEKHHAARFRFDELRRSFVIARGALRILLGHYVNVSPTSIEFKYGSRGKPALAGPACVEFNVSHSGGLALFAFTIGCNLGVDVEQIRTLNDSQRIADRFFCSDEAIELMSLTTNQRETAFYLCWTRKEAYIKATGNGLSAPLDSFRVTLRPGEPARFLRLGQDNNSAAMWRLLDLQLAPNYAAALAYCDKERPVDLFRISDAAELLNFE
jgi:4'-phosphopantetheinyl transferase